MCNKYLLKSPSDFRKLFQNDFRTIPIPFILHLTFEFPLSTVNINTGGAHSNMSTGKVQISYRYTTTDDATQYQTSAQISCMHICKCNKKLRNVTLNAGKQHKISRFVSLYSKISWQRFDTILRHDAQLDKTAKVYISSLHQH